ncbi:MAG: NAD(P)/FAD-dependent oxidoreductase [Elusimicrobia bacterium]|nr:NAD(P)/FAD-dependent oxidoreductase [Elusimicrobiota bacterium]
MSNKKVILIGAGVTGLCSGINLEKAGYEVEIYEMHSLPGGVCTAWKRNGYVFDGCINWLMGSSPDGYFHDLWREVGALDDTTKVVEYDVYSVVELSSGRKISIYTDPEKLEKEMLALSGEDEKEIKRFIRAIKLFSRLQFPADNVNMVGYIVRLAGFLISNAGTALMFIRLFGMDIKDYAKRFRNPDIRETILRIIDGDIGASMLVMMLGYMAKKANGFVIGGSLEFAKRIEKKYLSLGGKIFYDSRVKEIIVENNKATGIRLENRKICNADYIVSAADGYDTIYRMLGGKYKTPLIEEAYSKWKLFPATCQVSLGVADEFKNEPPMISFILKKKIITDPKSSTGELHLRILNFDRSLAPAGKTPVAVMLPADYDYWANLRNENKAEYDKQKKRIAEETIEAINNRFPGIKEKVEAVDVATPATYERYTNVWKGRWEGFWPNAKQVRKKIPYKIPGLSNFWMAGQWLHPGGGLPPALMDGKQVCSEICKKDRQDK